MLPQCLSARSFAHAGCPRRLPARMGASCTSERARNSLGSTHLERARNEFFLYPVPRPERLYDKSEASNKAPMMHARSGIVLPLARAPAPLCCAHEIELDERASTQLLRKHATRASTASGCFDLGLTLGIKIAQKP